MIKLQQFCKNNLDQIRLYNDKNGEQITILPEFGANVKELVLTKGSTKYSLLDGNNSREEMTGHAIYKGAKLIPFPNRVANGHYQFNGKAYQLECNDKVLNNALHGFIYDKPFTIENVDESENITSVTLTYNYSGNIIGYPFLMDMRITYTLSHNDGFICSTKITNTGKDTMPIGDGWHPYFTFNKPVDMLLIKLPAHQKINVNKQMIPTGGRVDFLSFSKLKPIGSSNLDTCFSVKNGLERYTTELHDPESGTTIRLWQETGLGKYNYLMAYIPPNRKSIAIEPMTCNMNAFNNKEGLIVLEKDQHFEAELGVQLV